jgi:hypothetical protein
VLLMTTIEVLMFYQYNLYDYIITNYSYIIFIYMICYVIIYMLCYVITNYSYIYIYIYMIC